MNEEQKIIIFSSEVPVSEDTELGDWKEKATEKLKEHAIDVTVLQNNIQNFFVNFNNVLDGSKEVEKKGFKLDQIEFSLQIGAKGEVGLFGTGVEVSGQGGIKFIIKREKQ